MLKYLLFILVLHTTLALTAQNKHSESEKELDTVKKSLPSHLNPDLNYGTVTDQNGNTYFTMDYGEAIWMAENLRAVTFANGDSIPNLTDNIEWGSTNKPAFRLYNDDSTNNFPYGKLYNWYTLADERNVCPTGWHVPTHTEWTLMYNSMGGLGAGGTLKSRGTKEKGTGYWDHPNEGANNWSGFSAVPAGYCDKDGAFSGLGIYALWWTMREADSNTAWYVLLFHNSAYISGATSYKQYGYPMRCVKD